MTPFQKQAPNQGICLFAGTSLLTVRPTFLHTRTTTVYFRTDYQLFKTKYDKIEYADADAYTL